MKKLFSQNPFTPKNELCISIGLKGDYYPDPAKQQKTDSQSFPANNDTTAHELLMKLPQIFGDAIAGITPGSVHEHRTTVDSELNRGGMYDIEPEIKQRRKKIDISSIKSTLHRKGITKDSTQDLFIAAINQRLTALPWVLVSYSNNLLYQSAIKVGIKHPNFLCIGQYKHSYKTTYGDNAASITCSGRFPINFYDGYPPSKIKVGTWTYEWSLNEKSDSFTLKLLKFDFNKKFLYKKEFAEIFGTTASGMVVTRNYSENLIVPDKIVPTELSPFDITSPKPFWSSDKRKRKLSHVAVASLLSLLLVTGVLVATFFVTTFMLGTSTSAMIGMLLTGDALLNMVTPIVLGALLISSLASLGIYKAFQRLPFRTIQHEIKIEFDSPKPSSSSTMEDSFKTVGTNIETTNASLYTHSEPSPRVTIDIPPDAVEQNTGAPTFAKETDTNGGKRLLESFNH